MVTMTVSAPRRPMAIGTLGLALLALGLACFFGMSSLVTQVVYSVSVLGKHSRNCFLL